MTTAMVVPPPPRLEHLVLFWGRGSPDVCVGVCVCWGGGQLASRGDLNAFLRDGKRLVKFQNINGYCHVFLLPGELGGRGMGVKAAVPPLHAGAMFAGGGAQVR